MINAYLSMLSYTAIVQAENAVHSEVEVCVFTKASFETASCL